MSGEFDDDVFGGTGKPTREQTIAVRDYLKRHNRVFSMAKVVEELTARGFTTSKASVGRDLKGVAGGNPPAPKEKSPDAKVQKKANANRNRRKQGAQPPAAIKGLIAESPIVQSAVKEIKEAVNTKLADLLKADKSSTQLAIDENRTRMALNIIIAETMASKPELLLVDMRGTAALVDAMTVACKVSGGPSIDIVRVGQETPGTVQDMGNPSVMKDVTPVKNELADELAEFRKRRGAVNGNGA